ncbi:hypothetical protein V8F20_009191 [Naviculisporaceae sp. PSN 640]
MSESKTHEIVILGGNFGGVGSAHYLLRHTIPALQKLDNSKTYHITLVTPNKDWFFKPATPRVLVAPNLLPEDKIWRSLAEIFKPYPTGQISIVQGVATNLDSSNKTVTVKLTTCEQKTIRYDSLIIATGTTGNPAFTLHEDQSLTSEVYKSVPAALKTAKTVLIAGGGAVGIETAGEIGVAFPQIEITLASGASKLLERPGNAKLSAQAEAYLRNHLQTKVINDLKVTSTSGGGDGPTIVTLSDGSTHTVDLYIDCTGGKPNSQFLPESWLDASGRVIKKDPYFRARGSSDSTNDAEDVYIVGDIVADSENSIWELEAHVPVVGTAIGNDIAAKIGQAGKAPAQREFKPIKGVMMVPIGPTGGVGQVLGWTVPSWFVKVTKAKSFLIDLLDVYAMGEKWKKP